MPTNRILCKEANNKQKKHQLLSKFQNCRITVNSGLVMVSCKSLELCVFKNHKNKNFAVTEAFWYGLLKIALDSDKIFILYCAYQNNSTRLVYSYQT